MAPHLMKAELDKVLQLAGDGKTPSEVHRFIAPRRAKKQIRPPVIEVIRRVVAGSSFRRGAKETRGRKRKWSTANARRANATRIRLYKDAKGEREITWSESSPKVQLA